MYISLKYGKKIWLKLPKTQKLNRGLSIDVDSFDKSFWKQVELLNLQCSNCEFTVLCTVEFTVPLSWRTWGSGGFSENIKIPFSAEFASSKIANLLGLVLRPLISPAPVSAKNKNCH